MGRSIVTHSHLHCFTFLPCLFEMFSGITNVPRLQEKLVVEFQSWFLASYATTDRSCMNIYLPHCCLLFTSNQQAFEKLHLEVKLTEVLHYFKGGNNNEDKHK